MKSSYPRNISIISFIFIFLIIFLAAVNLYINIQFRNGFIGYEQSKISRLATLCAYYLQTIEVPEQLHSFFKNLSRTYELKNIIITDTLNNVIYDSRRFGLNPINLNYRVDFSKEFSQLPTPGMTINQGDVYLYYHEDPAFYMYTTLNTPYRVIFDRLFKWHIFYITLSLLFIGFLGIFLLRNLLLPMRYVTHIAQDFGIEMQKEDFVSKTFNEIFKKIKSKEETLVEFSAYVAHEFRNSIGAIIGLARLVEKGKKPAADIINECRIMEELINRLLEFSRPLQLELSTIDVKQLIEEAIKRTSGSEGITIKTKIASQIPGLTGDYELLVLSLKNILKNCVESIVDRGIITINAGYDDNNIIISITDNGTGIELQDIEKIFTPFYSKKAQGMGLGLAYVKKVLEAHKARINVTSKKGRGTTFTLLFPLV